MLDLCPRCRIQAPHRDERDRCPRCGGSLTVVADDAQASVVVAAYHESVRRPVPAPVVTQAPSIRPSVAARPVSSRAGAPRMYGARPVRWVARRPADSLPSPRPPRRPRVRRIPRYVAVPQWGLVDVPVTADDTPSVTTRLGAALTTALQITGATLVSSALAHLLRYLLLVVNRSTPLPGWLIAISTVLVMVAGVLALGALVYTTVVFVRWLLAQRAESYAGCGFTDPRPRWASIPLAAIPLINVVGAPLLLYEAAAMATGSAEMPAAVAARLRKLWVAWAIVNAVALAAVLTWWIGAASGSVQTGADALVLVTVSAAVSAAFAFWAAPRLAGAMSPAGEAAVPVQRWVIAA